MNGFPSPEQLAPPPDPTAAPAAPPPEPMEEPSLAQPAADPHEAAWLSDRDAAQEAIFAHIGAGLLLAPKMSPGRNVLSEAEHAHSTRAARDLLAGRSDDSGDSADEHAASAGDGAGLSYLRDNADSLHTTLSTKQAKAAQRILDSYGELAHLRSSPSELEGLIATDNVDEQARWVSHTKRELAQAVQGAPDEVREEASKFGSGRDPAGWFAQATALSDTLARAGVKAGRTDQEAADQLRGARDLLQQGTTSEGLWGRAAKHEEQRSAGFEKRYGDHIDAFEEAFTSRVGDRVQADPEKFRAFVAGDQSGDQAKALSSMLDSARATADTAAKFGKGREAGDLLSSVGELQRSLARSRTVRAAEGGVPRETAGADASDAALAFLGGDSEPATPDATRAGVLKATGAMTVGTAVARRASVRVLLSPAVASDGDPEDIELPPSTALTEESYPAAQAHIQKMAADPDYFATVMASSLGRMNEAAPEVYQALSAQTAKTVQYLAAVAPGGTTGGPFPQTNPVAADELWEFNQRLGAAADPTFIPSQIAQGRVSATAIEAYQVMQPKQYSELRTDIFERLHEMKQEGLDVPMQAREQIETILQIDGGGEPAMTWRAAEQAANAQQRKASAASVTDGGAKPGGHAAAMQSGALATLSNGASALGARK